MEIGQVTLRSDGREDVIPLKHALLEFERAAALQVAMPVYGGFVAPQGGGFGFRFEAMSQKGSFLHYPDDEGTHAVLAHASYYWRQADYDATDFELRILRGRTIRIPLPMFETPLNERKVLDPDRLIDSGMYSNEGWFALEGGSDRMHDIEITFGDLVSDKQIRMRWQGLVKNWPERAINTQVIIEGVIEFRSLLDGSKSRMMW